MNFKRTLGLLGVRLHQFLSASMLFDKRVSGSGRVFFPGCGMAGYSPELVMNVYGFLREVYPGIGIFGSCCAKPSQAFGAGSFLERARVLTRHFSEAGVKRVITACPNCAATLACIPNISVVPIWRVLDEHFDQLKDRLRISGSNLPPLSLHDPCQTREDESVQNSVRSVLRRAHVEFSEFPMAKRAMCCGKAGMLMAINPAASRKILQRCVEQSPTPNILTYCFSCADSFRSAGRRSFHSLELLFADELVSRPRESVWRNRFRASRLIARLGDREAK
ncbi:hypothetical protein AGMMS50276_28140 [Synergistales bacterium]|nr:hypothetical protein AGMMS50276_28140 [Synergistales bacterium]